MAMGRTPPCGFSTAMSRLAKRRSEWGIAPDRMSFTNPRIAPPVRLSYSPAARTYSYVHPLSPAAMLEPDKDGE